MKFIPEQLRRLEYWIKERESMRIHKDAGRAPPFSSDPYMAKYRYCNVVRMDDRVSRWLFAKWYDTNAKPHALIVAATIARLINEPRTLACIPFPYRWDEGQLREILTQLCGQTATHYSSAKLAVFGNAYLVVGTEFADGGKKNVLPRIVSRVAGTGLGGKTNPLPDTMVAAHAMVQSVRGLGSFLAGQIVADLRHLIPGYFTDAHDWAPLGPGSARGMARLLGREVRRTGMTQQAFLPLLQQLMKVVKLPASAAQRVEAMDMQNCLCEFDKYSRLFEGRKPRRLYP